MSNISNPREWKKKNSKSVILEKSAGSEPDASTTIRKRIKNSGKTTLKSKEPIENQSKEKKGKKDKMKGGTIIEATKGAIRGATREEIRIEGAIIEDKIRRNTYQTTVSRRIPLIIRKEVDQKKTITNPTEVVMMTI